MILSSGTRHSGLVGGVVALHGPQNVETAACETQDGL